MKRLDILLFERQLFPSRDKAKEAIIQGQVKCGDKICNKPGEKFDENSKFEIADDILKYVSRAALKLEKAAEEFKIDFHNKTVIDVGASTGGFTEFCINSGAKKVYAVDVGQNQLAEKLKENPKVTSLEKTDFRKLSPLPDKIDIAVCDCSFISLKLLLPKFCEVLEPEKELVVLIKPQFECGMKIAKKCKGVIKDKKLQEDICNEIVEYFAPYFNLIGLCPSPILGTSGNKEFLAYFKRK